MFVEIQSWVLRECDLLLSSIERDEELPGTCTDFLKRGYKMDRPKCL